MRLSLKAIAVGGVVDIVATNLAAIPLVIGVIAQNATTLAVPPTDDAIMAAMGSSPTLFTAGLVLGSFCTMLGGWVAARIAGRDELLHGALSGYLCVAASLYAWFRGTGDLAAWERFAFIVLSPALGALG